MKNNDLLSSLPQKPYQIKVKSNSDMEIMCGKLCIAKLIVQKDAEKKTSTYELMLSKEDKAIFRFVRSDNSMAGFYPESDQTVFSWKRLSTTFSELYSGLKWQCDTMILSQNIIRSLTMWIPRISWFIPTKYTISENDFCHGVITGAVFSFSNGKNVTVATSEKALEIMAAAIILAEEEIG